MAFSLQNKKAIVEKFYKDYIENLVKGKTSKNYSTLKNENSRIADLKRSASLYIKLEGANSDINSAEDLFDLAKMLGLEQSEEYVIDSDEGKTISKYEPRIRQVIQVPLLETIGKIPTGASDSIKHHIFQQKFFPLIEKHYAKVLKSPDFDDISKSVLKSWWAERSSSFSTTFITNISESIIDVQSLNDLDGQFIDIAGIENNAVKLRKVFFTSLFAKDGNFKANILDALGFSQYLRDHKEGVLLGLIGTGSGVLDPLLTLEGLEQAAKMNPEGYAQLVTSTLNISTNITEEEFNELNQCALVTALVHNEPKFNFRKYIEDRRYKSTPLQKNGLGNKRIYPVQVNNYNPNKLINNCVINRKVKHIFNDGDTKGPHNMVKGLFWVYEDNKKELREAELSTNSTVHRKKISKTLFDMMDDIDNASLEDIGRFDKFEKQKDSSYYFLENTKITFDGTNPSTARNDVKVELTWKLGSLEGLSSTMAILGTSDGLDTDTEVVIKDLITLPITKKPNSTDGPGQFITNQYSPNYSRLRLKVAPYGNREKTHLEDCMILDLAIIDHQINRSSETGETTLAITYRGYFEATLNMPYNDALASPNVITKRATRQREALDKLMTNDCKPELIREALRLEQEVFKKESSNPSAGEIIIRMQGRQLIHAYELDNLKFVAGRFGDVLDGRKMYVHKVIPRTSAHLSVNDSKQLAEIVFNKSVDTEDGSTDDADPDRVSALRKIDKKFFFLGDLMWTLLDCLYKPHSAVHRTTLDNLNLRFIMGTIYVPNPKDLGGSPITINPITIPVDLKFFVQWFNATIVNKGLTHYPIGTFIRDLVERLVNDIIYDTCFSLLLPDENPPLLRARTFTSNQKDWFKKTIKGAWFDPNNPHGGGSMDLLFPKSLVSSNSRENTWSQKIISKNYCVIYQQFPSYKRQLAAEKNSTLKQDEYTPTIYYGAKNKNYNFLSDVSFEKTNSPYLREARFFNTNYGGLSLLSNVYDLSFSFKKRKANTLFYPGCIINFVLVDWGKRWVDEPPWTGKGKWAEHHLGESPNPPIVGFQQGRLGESDPHNEGTISNIMGMGGYFIIKSVEYNLGETPGEFEINISTKFLGTDSAKTLNRTSNKEKFAGTSDACAAVYNTIAERHNELSRGVDGYEPIVTLDVSTDDTSNTSERVNEDTSNTGERVNETGGFRTEKYGTKLLPSITDIISGSPETKEAPADGNNPFAIFEEPVDE